MGVVYRARQLSLNRVVALKRIRAGELAGSEEVARFRAEAEAAAQLDHPNIVPIFEVGEQDGLPYFSMGYVDGPSLQARLKDGPLSPREAADLVRTLAEAVQYAHEKGIVHRDLKPANVLIDADGKPRITDFGLAKNIAGDSGMTATGQVMGTPSYMPPEQAAGKTDEIGPLADVYSLGAVLYALLTGRPPFQAASVMETLKQVLDQEPVSPRQLNPAVPRDLETICLTCLQKSPPRRYPSAQKLQEDLTRFVEGRPVTARPVSVAEQVWRWCARNRIVASLLTTVFVLLVTGLITSGTLLRWESEARAQAEENGENYLKAAEEADAARRQTEKNYAIGLLERIGTPTRINSWASGERRAIRELAAIEGISLRLVFLEQGLKDEASAKRLIARAPHLAIALTGLNRSHRRQVLALLQERLKSASEETVREACALLGVLLQADEPVFWQTEAEIVIDRIRTTTTTVSQADLAHLQAALKHVPSETAPRLVQDTIAAIETRFGKYSVEVTSLDGLPETLIACTKTLPQKQAQQHLQKAANTLLKHIQRDGHITREDGTRFSYGYKTAEELAKILEALLTPQQRLIAEQALASIEARIASERKTSKRGIIRSDSSFAPIVMFLSSEKAFAHAAKQYESETSLSQYSPIRNVTFQLIKRVPAETRSQFAEKVVQRSLARLAKPDRTVRQDEEFVQIIEFLPYLLKDRRPTVVDGVYHALVRSLNSSSSRFAFKDLTDEVDRLKILLGYFNPSQLKTLEKLAIGKFRKASISDMADWYTFLGRIYHFQEDEGHTGIGVAHRMLMTELTGRRRNASDLASLTEALVAISPFLSPQIRKASAREFAEILVQRIAAPNDRPISFSNKKNAESLSLVLPLLDTSRAESLGHHAAKELFRQHDNPPIRGQQTGVIEALQFLASSLDEEQAWRLASLLQVGASRYRFRTSSDRKDEVMQQLSTNLGSDRLVELLKDPMCTGRHRNTIVKELGRRVGITFDNEWAFAKAYDQERKSLDLDSPWIKPRKVKK